ncbi:Phosphatidylglycerol lysyltransferase [Halomonadaceae bacterium LMG 33818]|uniref:phosphatidylglycerol lysyltransferase domain-containing protein n=1 Tax=Cernens ardua TaxID=3402176 RepID=UPI003EDB986D
MSDSPFTRVRGLVARYRHALGIAVTLVVFGLAVTVCWRLLHEVNPHLLKHAFLNVSVLEVAGAMGAAMFSYLMLVGYEWSALRYAGVKGLPSTVMVMGGTCASAIGNAIGLSMLSGGAVRCRLYFRHGLAGPDVARISVFVSLALGLTLPVLAAVAALIDVETAADALRIPTPLVVWIASSVLGIYAVALVILLLRRQDEKPSEDSRLYALGNWAWRLPSLRISLLQLLITLGDVVGSATVLYLLLPHHPPFSTFLLIYLLALAAGVLSHVPGGIGVFEAIMLSSFSHIVGAAPLTAALVLYRAIYIVLPLLLSCLTLLISEGRRMIQRRQDVQLNAGLAPGVLSLILFFCGLLLELSNVMPEYGFRMALLLRWVPPAVLELSHFCVGLLGLLCLLMARGLRRRLARAWGWSVCILLLASIGSLLKGLDIPQAILLFVAAIALIVFKRAFYRTSSLKHHLLSASVLWMSAGCVAVSLWLTLYIYQDVPYRSLLWWQFAPFADMSRALRSVLGSGVLLCIIVALWQMRSHVKPLSPASDRVRQHAFDIAEHSDQPESIMSSTLSTHFLFNQDFSAFIGYKVVGEYLLALGGPTGSMQDQASLRWDFRDLSDEHHHIPLFYPVSGEDMPLYQDIGLYPVRVAEEALIELAYFNEEALPPVALDVASRLSFELIPSREVDIDTLQALCLQWSQQPLSRVEVSTSEPTSEFVHTHIAIVREKGRDGGEIVAFVCVLETPQADTRVLDTLHYMPDSAHSDSYAQWLIASLAKESQREKLVRLSLGSMPVLPVRLGHLGVLTLALNATTCHLGGKGETRLRQFVRRFNPVWKPRYLLLPHGADATRALATLSGQRKAALAPADG